MNSIMSKQLPDYSKINILVVGDVMLDRYWQGQTERISPEAPVPVVGIDNSEQRPGGAGNVARSITALGGNCTLLGLVGNDSYAKQLEGLLLEDNISLQCISDKSAETINKLRVLSRNQQLIRLDFDHKFSEQCIEKLTSQACSSLEIFDVILLSDYGKGALDDIEKIIESSVSSSLPVFIDPKGNNFVKYRGATAITPNQSEFFAVVGSCSSESEITEKGQNLLSSLELQALIITRSDKGVMLLEKNGQCTNIPARTKEVFDVTGAGDTFISVVAASFAAGASFLEAVNIANAAASVVVGKLGAATVSTSEIEHELNNTVSSEQKIVKQAQLKGKISEFRELNKIIVFTNGCFDILHPGHVQYLERAKSFGDVLIVAVNSDKSVTRLKGKSRPINSLEDRIKVLEGLQSVDYIVSFDQDTPEQLISDTKPDVLVKGGDYSVDEITGSDTVQANGGRVEVIKFIENCSTSNMIDKIVNKQK